jgi:hypothetical protein
MLNRDNQRIVRATRAKQSEIADIGEQPSEIMAGIEGLLALLNLRVRVPEHRPQSAFGASATEIRTATKLFSGQ